LSIGDGNGGSGSGVPISSVTRIEQVNGPVIWLSSLAPLENVQMPYIGIDAHPARMDRTVEGEPIRIGSRTFARGIGVHAYSKLVFAIDAAAREFRTQYA